MTEKNSPTTEYKIPAVDIFEKKQEATDISSEISKLAAQVKVYEQKYKDSQKGGDPFTSEDISSLKDLANQIQDLATKKTKLEEEIMRIEKRMQIEIRNFRKMSEQRKILARMHNSLPGVESNNFPEADTSCHEREEYMGILSSYKKSDKAHIYFLDQERFVDFKTSAPIILKPTRSEIWNWLGLDINDKAFQPTASQVLKYLIEKYGDEYIFADMYFYDFCQENKELNINSIVFLREMLNLGVDIRLAGFCFSSPNSGDVKNVSLRGNFGSLHNPGEDPYTINYAKTSSKWIFPDQAGPNSTVLAFPKTKKGTW